MSTFRFPDSWTLDTDPAPPTPERISYEINPTILGKPTPRPGRWWAYMLDPWPLPETAAPPPRALPR